MDNSPFGRLSPELRNKIYNLALPPLRVLRPAFEGRLDTSFHHPLTNNCRQLRAETLLMNYEGMHIWPSAKVCYQEAQTEKFAAWLNTLGAVACKNICCIDAFFCSFRDLEQRMRRPSLKSPGQGCAVEVIGPGIEMMPKCEWTPVSVAVARVLKDMGQGLCAFTFGISEKFWRVAVVSLEDERSLETWVV